ncbi:MAG: phage minor head protein [Neorhizobium sp.]|nr:phage minor head protein [Neorhizobium sp.]
MTQFVRIGSTPYMAFDKGGSEKSAFLRARKAEVQYGRQLRKVAQHVGDIVRGLYNPTEATVTSAIEQALTRYSSTIEAWAQSVGNRMVTEVAARDRKAWMEVSRRMGQSLREEIDNAPTGLVLRERLADQVTLIKSIPLDAAERVHKLALEGITQGRRSNYIAEEIMRSGHVSRSKADLIARTEVSRTASLLTEARAVHIGSTGYIWRTAKDTDVRHSHAEMEGKFVPWGSPPTLDGMRGHAGQFPRCRCYPEPVIPLD